jgi:peptidoglycan hydrolase-like protein with peptidoglycan-binding domain
VKYAPAFLGIATRLRQRGFTVIEQPGWQTRGHGDFADIESVVLHHTVDNPPADYPSLKIVTSGRPDLAGPLCNFGVGRAGTIFLVAAGVAWHAGATKESWQSNSHSVGIEAANNGVGEPWGDPIIRAYVALVEEIQRQFDVPSARVLGHKEVCTPNGRKIDPSFNTTWFRSLLGYNLGPSGTAGPSTYTPATPTPVAPAPEDESRRAPDHLPTIRRGTSGTGWTALVQGVLGIDVDDDFGPGTEKAVKAAQKAAGLSVYEQDGIVGMQTWCQVLLARKGVLQAGKNKGEPVVELLQNLVGYRGADLDRDFGPATAARVKQVQRWGGLTGADVDGVVGPQTRAIFALG